MVKDLLDWRLPRSYRAIPAEPNPTPQTWLESDIVLTQTRFRPEIPLFGSESGRNPVKIRSKGDLEGGVRRGSLARGVGPAGMALQFLWRVLMLDLSLASIFLCASGVQLPVSSGIRHCHSLALELWLPTAQQKARRKGVEAQACLMGPGTSGMERQQIPYKQPLKHPLSCPIEVPLLRNPLRFPFLRAPYRAPLKRAPLQPTPPPTSEVFTSPSGALQRNWPVSIPVVIGSGNSSKWPSHPSRWSFAVIGRSVPLNSN